MLEFGKVKKKITGIDRILVKMYGEKKQVKFSDATEELILTILSQNTNDVNRDRAFKSLRAKFPHWTDVENARESSIASAIKVGGLANTKSKRIKKILKQIGGENGDYSLKKLKRLNDQKAWEYLTAFEGVGPKTASCVLMFALGRKTMPVDTHVHRLGKRLGIIPENYSAENSHDWFRNLNLKTDVYQLHLNLISHGREMCRSRNPDCGNCLLKKQCNFFREIEK
jgi:endonuclease-3